MVAFIFICKKNMDPKEIKSINIVMRSEMTLAMDSEMNFLKESYNIETQMWTSYIHLNQCGTHKEETTLYAVYIDKYWKLKRTVTKLEKKITAITVYYFCNGQVFILQASLSFLVLFYA